MAINLVSLAEVKTYLGVTTVNDDQLLSDLIASVSAFIRHKTHRTFEEASYTESHSGGNYLLILDHRPIVSVASITDTDDSETVDAANYVLFNDEGMVARIDDNGDRTKWADGWRRFEVTYTAGYSLSPDTIPDDVKMAAKMLIGARYQRRNGDLQSEDIDGYSYTIKENYADEAMDLLGPYKEHAF